MSLNINVTGQCAESEQEVKVVINPDNFPNEISWELTSIEGLALLDGTFMGDSICVDTGLCLNFTIYDSSSDGLCCGFGQGSYEVYINNELKISGGEYRSIESTVINCPVGYSCSDVDTIIAGNYTAPIPDFWYAFIPEETASYSISTCDVSSCNTILFIYDRCINFNSGDSNEGTTFYNDDHCEGQSEITGAFEAGVTYYLRVGDYESDCENQSINFEIINNGPISGCIDPTACNYNPLATVDDGSCIYEGADCPGGADLVVSQSHLLNSLQLTTINNQNQCTIDEGCLSGFNQRDIIRFTTYIANIGDEDFFIGVPTEDNPLYTYDNCHQHWHYRGYAEYILYDEAGVELPIGFKNGFCVIDLDCSAGGTGKYSCGNQGITAQCADFYNSNLSCQWIDITDVEPGIYTFVIRVNWERSPDALGKYESNYNNNWAQVCLDIGRNSNDRPTMSVLNECSSYEDCLGEIFGSAQPDCTGVCNGSTIKGDINESGDLENLDVGDYLSGMAERSLTATDCNDINGDGEIHVSDAAKLAACLFFGENSTDVEAPNEPCTFGDQVVNPNQDALFSIINNNYEENYFEIGLFNENSFVLGFEIDISGATILNAESLVVNNEYDGLPIFNITGDKIVSVSSLHRYFLKKTEMESILRVYHNGFVDDEICINVIEVINKDYHVINSDEDMSCVAKIVSSNQEILNAGIKIYPNPTKALINIEYDDKLGDVDRMIIRNAQGQEVYNQIGELNSVRNIINVAEWVSGVYFFEIHGDQRANGRFIVL